VDALQRCDIQMGVEMEIKMEMQFKQLLFKLAATNWQMRHRQHVANSCAWQHMLATFSNQKKRRKTENKKNQQPPSYDSNMANAKMPTICVHTHLDAKTMMMVVYCFQWCGGAAVLWRCGAADNDDSQSGKTCETWANNYTWIPDQLDVVSALFPPFQYPRSGCHCNCCLFGVGF